MVATEPPNNIDGVSETATGVRPVRIFVALRIAPEIALELAQYSRGLEQFSVRLVAPADIHLTLVPPWNEVSIADAVEKLRRVADQVLLLSPWHSGISAMVRSQDARAFCGRSALPAKRSRSYVWPCFKPLGRRMNGRFVRM